ncbi:GNAT family N-acetyltransferase OS=Streptomyces rimosus subsp. rimosus (strain ATCC/ DSM 40260 / JCM 4667 / NRRL 2234) OX=1265868 GN=SRIM_009620 PE=4 SV=1 [Streptomyces rimosus subsp. rimosus]
MDRLDRDLRGAGHGPDHGCLLAAHRLVVTRDRSRPGYVYVDDRGNAVLLAAERVDTAQRLLWEALAASYGDTLVNCITVPNEWAIDVGLAAGLAISQEGYIAVRGMPVPAPVPGGRALPVGRTGTPYGHRFWPRPVLT